MHSQISSPVDDILLRFHDGKSTCEDELKETLAHVVALETGAYDSLLRCLANPSPQISRPALEFLLSCPEQSNILRECLVQSLPVLPDHFSASSTAMTVLEKLSLSIPLLHPFSRDVFMKLNRSRVQVVYGPAVIEALLRFITVTSGQSQDAEIEELAKEDGLVLKTKQSQRQRKAAKTRTPPIFDSKLAKACAVLEICIPETVAGARHDLHALFKSLCDILGFYLDLLRDPEVAADIRQTFTRTLDTFATEDVVPADADAPPSNDTDAKADIPVAFPMVQPMKAALYFESAEGFGEWRILISTRADRDLRDARRRDTKFFKILVKKIKELSNGHFSSDNQKRLTGTNTEVPIYEAKMTRDSRLVYQIDCLREYNTDLERQVIKIFGVYTHAQFDKRLWESVSYQLGKKGSEYKRRCEFRTQPSLAGDKTFTPACFPPAEKEEEELKVIPEIPAESLEEIHSLLVLEKFVPFSQALLNSIIADLDVAHVFDVSPQEMEIIHHPFSCYVLGRSGTGKTTTMLFKMLGMERAYEMCKDTMSKPRQVFVTQSRVLAGKVEEYFSKLLNSLSTGNKTREELADLVKSKQQQLEDEGLVDLDDDTNWRSDLPSKFSELRDEHFPLFVTFDRLASLLEADIPESSASSAMAGNPLESGDSNRRNRHLITYDIFLASFWPHFSQTLKKGLDPALVYSELMGVIQGSEESLGHESRYLDKVAYQNLSERTQYAFATRREVVYSIFLAYLKQKKSTGSYDAPDRTHHILKTFQSIGVPGQKLDYLYVDEAQDNLLIDALLLRSLVKNPDGLFWAGDTAQTISVGSSFRFNDLKAFLFRLEKRREESFMGSEPIVVQEAPRTFHLAINYRSHGGIVQCAHSVIQLITNFWPYAIDVLSREKGVVDGSRPVFFSGWDSETVRYEQFLFGESGSPIEFGAQQCILVRNEAAREELRAQVGDIGLILTLYESKGLEFDDVLLYKFFEDSSVDLSQWRVVLNLLGDDNSTSISAPRFDDVRHAGVCSELKFLYVAITRARKNLWIVDCSETSEPMRAFWTARNEVQNCTPGTDVPRLAVSSSPEEWEKTGRSLFANKRYMQAMHCFERAGLPREVTVAHTHYLREQARAISVTTGSKQSILQRQKAYLDAAEAFLQCSLSAINAKERVTYLRNAGACFEEAQEEFKAANAFNEAREFTKAAKLYRKCAKFDEAVAVVTKHRDDVELEVVENIIDIARLFYFKSGELEKATPLFDSVEEQLEYLEDFDLDLSRAAVLETLGKYQDAAEVHLSEGRTLEAIRLFLKADTDPVAIRRGEQAILQGLWENMSFDMRQSERQEEIDRLLHLAVSVRASKIADPIVVEELTIFESIHSRDLKQLRVLGKGFESKGNLISALLCFDYAFRSVPNMNKMTQAEVSDFLQDFLVFAQVLFKIASKSNVKDGNIQKLFRIVISTDNSFMLPAGTFLHQQFVLSRAAIEDSNDQGILVSEWELNRKFKGFLLNRLVMKLKAEIDASKQAEAFTPCLGFIVNNGHCHRKECPHVHLRTNTLTRDWFIMQIRIHLQQILLVHGLTMVATHPRERILHFSHWIGSLFNTLYPALFCLGHFANVDAKSIPEIPSAFLALRNVCNGILFYPGHSSRDPKLLTAAYHVTRMAYFMDQAKPYPAILRSPLNNALRTLPQDSHHSGGSSATILSGIATALLGSHIKGALLGIQSLSDILKRQIHVDANVLFDLIDIVSGSVILTRRSWDLHNVTLPLSWLNVLLRMIKLDLKTDVSSNVLIQNLMGVLRLLMDRFVTRHQELGHLLVGNSDLFNLHLHRNIYLSRLCRAICLVGYNVNNDMLRGEIMLAMKALHVFKSPHNLIRDYSSVRQWSHISRAVQRSVNGSPLDEMIQLYQGSRVVAAKPPPPGIRRVLYKNAVDIPKILEGSMAFSNLRADAPAFVPQPRAADEATPDEEAEPATEEPEVDTSEIVNNGNPVEVAVVEVADENLPPSEEYIKAAVLFQTLYRHLIRIRKLRSKMTSLDVSRENCVKDCLAQALLIDWPTPSYYGMLYQGPLPHLLVCLSAVHAWVMTNKQKNKARFRSAEHQELEDVNKRLTEQKKTIDEIRRLQKALNPEAPLHKKRDVEELKKLVLQVEEMVGRVAPSVAREVSEDMQMAIKGIVTVKKMPKPKAKPTLIIDDEDGDGYDDYREDHSDTQEIRKVVVVSDKPAKDAPLARGLPVVVQVPAAPSAHEDEIEDNDGGESGSSDDGEDESEDERQTPAWDPVPPTPTEEDSEEETDEDEEEEDEEDEETDQEEDEETDEEQEQEVVLSWIPI